MRRVQGDASVAAESPYARLRRQAAELDEIRCPLEPLVVSESELESIAEVWPAVRRDFYRAQLRKGTLKIGKHPVWLL